MITAYALIHAHILGQKGVKDLYTVNCAYLFSALKFLSIYIGELVTETSYVLFLASKSGIYSTNRRIKLCPKRCCIKSCSSDVEGVALKNSYSLHAERQRQGL